MSAYYETVTTSCSRMAVLPPAGMLQPTRTTSPAFVARLLTLPPADAATLGQMMLVDPAQDDAALAAARAVRQESKKQRVPAAAATATAPLKTTPPTST